MSNFKERLSANAAEFDTIVAELVAENERLRNQVAPEPEPPKPWPLSGEEYWYIGTLEPLLNVYSSHSAIDASHFSRGKAFRTQREAEMELEREKIEQELRDAGGDVLEALYYVDGTYNNNRIVIETVGYERVKAVANWIRFRKLP